MSNEYPEHRLAKADAVHSIITSTQNPLVKSVRRLHQAKDRHQAQAFLLEGTHLLQEACAVDLALEVLCATVDWQQQHPELWQQASARATRTELVSAPALAAMATTVHPDGVIAVAPRRPNRQPAPNAHLTLLLDRLQDPGNLGTIIRTAVAAGADGLWLTAQSVELENPKVLRASAGQWFRLPMASCEYPIELLHNYRQQGGQVVATSMTAAIDYWQLDFTPPTLILLGNEGGGLSPELLAEADHTVRVPMATGVESLNVSITAALLLYEARRQRQSP
jgi:RNA methyltransferase, TrmH family